MANLHDTPSLPTADVSGVTVFRGDASPTEIFDSIAMRIAGVAATAKIISNEDGLEAFKAWNESIQHDYLAELAFRIEEIRTAVMHLGEVCDFTPRER